jgi:antitoxin ParD1/3/4
MELSLTPELESFIQQQVESGHFASANEVILTALNSYKDLEHAAGREAFIRSEVLSEEEVFDNLRNKLRQPQSRED